jgi:hypothetical protein
MQPKIVHGQWFEVDGSTGTEWVDAGLIESPEEYLARIEAQHEEVSGGCRYDPIPDPLATYCENTRAWTIRLVDGWGARHSAPGYLDATPWSVFETEEEAREYLQDEQADE